MMLKSNVKYVYLLILSAFIACTSNEKMNLPEAKKGVLDLRGWNFKVNGPVSLNGEWEYYWYKLYQPQDYKKALPQIDGYINVPGKWFNSTTDSNLFTINGFMTYRLVVLTDHLNEKLLLYAVRAPATACQIYINDQLVAENGLPEKTKELSNPSGMLDAYPFNYSSDTMKIVIPVSNFHSGFDAGLFHEIKLGELKGISNYKEKELRHVNFISGLVFFIFLYNILIFYFMSEDKVSLYLSLFSLCVLITSLSYTGIANQILSLNSSFYKFIETIWLYFLFMMGVILFAYLFTLYNDGSKKNNHQKYYIIYAVIVLILLLAWQGGLINNLKYGLLLLNTLTFLIGVAELCCLYLVISAVLKKKKYAYHNLITVLFLLSVLIISSFYEGYQRGLTLFSFGSIVFLAMQTYIVSDRFVRTSFVNLELRNDLLQLNKNLQNLVRERTQQLEEQNDTLFQQKEELQSTLESLNRTQEQLVESAKMAAIGGLVAGVAHELNTPVGIGVTAISNLLDDIQKIADLYEKDKISRKDFKGFLESTNDTAKLLQKNLERTAALIQSFKQVSTDQVTEQQRVFAFREYLNDILISLRPKFREKKIEFKIECDNELRLNSYPGIYAQIFTNLLLNSLQHGFYKRETGSISIRTEIVNNLLKIYYGDDGMGISKKAMPHIFEPFFTSDQNRGTGLGLNIIYNLVKQKLHGTIICESDPGKGVLFKLEVPLID